MFGPASARYMRDNVKVLTHLDIVCARRPISVVFLSVILLDSRGVNCVVILYFYFNTFDIHFNVICNYRQTFQSFVAFPKTSSSLIIIVFITFFISVNLLVCLHNEITGTIIIYFDAQFKFYLIICFNND